MLWCKLLMIMLTLFLPSIALKSILLLTVIFGILIFQNQIKPYLTKKLNRLEFTIYLSAATILMIKIIAYEINKKYTLLFTIFIFIIKIYVLLMMVKNVMMFKLMTIKFFQNLTIFNMNEMIKSKIFL